MIGDANEKLRSMLSEKRYIHSLGVQKTAIDLAKKYNCDAQKASIAGLVHDCAKGFSDEKLMEASAKYDIQIGMVYEKQPGLLHGPVGAYVARDEFLIDDMEILHAIKYHTTGCENMSMLDKIIYIADYIEPGRDFPGVDSLREETYLNIDRGLLMAFDNTIRYVIDRGELIDTMTVRARNSLLCHSKP
jgi:putative HD superfamily hydrolase of NAD metabolism